MKYKVVLYNTQSSADTDTAGNFSFYTFNAAHECCQSWAAITAQYEAWLWDGATWRKYV